MQATWIHIDTIAAAAAAAVAGLHTTCCHCASSAAQAFAWRNQGFNYMWTVPTFKEYIDIARNANRTVCIYPETKHPTFFNNHPTLKAAGVTIDDLVMKELREKGYNLQVSGCRVDPKIWVWVLSLGWLLACGCC